MGKVSSMIRRTAAGLLTAAAVFMLFTACGAKTEFELGGNDKTVSAYTEGASFSVKLSPEKSGEFISLINAADLNETDYYDVDSSAYTDLCCIFLNKDSIMYSVLQSKSDGSMFCIRTYADEVTEGNKTLAAYTFKSTELSQVIAEIVKMNTESEANGSKTSEESESTEAQMSLEAETTGETSVDVGEKSGELKDSINDLISELCAKKITGSDVWWSYYPPESYRIEHFSDENFSDNWGSIQGNLTESDLDYIKTTLLSADFELLSEQPVCNTDFRIWLDFEDGSAMSLTADDEEIYMNIRTSQDGWFYTKVLHIGLFEYLLGFAGEGGFDTEWVAATESVTIYYVKEADRKDYPENKKLIKIEIGDSGTVSRIAEAVFLNVSQTMTYPSRENADIIFHTPEGDYYGKIKFPVTTDENGISEPTIIMNGYYWYSCEELYNILIAIENAG